MKRIIITSERLNSHGTWLVTAGGDLEQYRRNPILLYMHRRGEVVGVLKNIKVETDGTISAEPDFDEATELSKQLKKQYEFGSINMCSVSADIVESSDDPALIKPGQRYATVTRWRLREVSLCDIGSNDDAIKLYRDNRQLNLSDGDQMGLRAINLNNLKTDNMDLKTIATMLALADTATEQQVRDKVASLQAAEQENITLKADKNKLQLAAITTIVDAAVAERKIAATDKEHFLTLGKQIGAEALTTTVGKMSPATKVTDALNLSAGAAAGQAASSQEYSKLSDVPADKLELMRKNNSVQYAKLYRSEYGIDPDFSND